MWITLRVKEAPERGRLFCAGRLISYAPDARCDYERRIRRSAGHIFSAIGIAGCLRRPILFCLARKEWGEKRRWTRNSAFAPEKACRSILRFVVTQAVVRTPFGRAAEFLRSKTLLRQIFVPAKSKSICPESMRRLSGFVRFCSAASIGCRRETNQAKKPKVREFGA